MVSNRARTRTQLGPTQKAMLLTWVGEESLEGKTNSNYALDVVSLPHFLLCTYAQLLFVHLIREPESNYQAGKHVLP